MGARHRMALELSRELFLRSRACHSCGYSLNSAASSRVLFLVYFLWILFLLSPFSGSVVLKAVPTPIIILSKEWKEVSHKLEDLERLWKTPWRKSMPINSMLSYAVVVETCHIRPSHVTLADFHWGMGRVRWLHFTILEINIRYARVKRASLSIEIHLGLASDGMWVKNPSY